MSYQDIAATMGLSVQAIKSLLSRARVNLKEILTPYVESGARPDESEPKAGAPPPDDDPSEIDDPPEISA